MDPVKFNWNEFKKSEQKLTRFFSKRDLWLARISDFMFGVGVIVSIISVIALPTPLNYWILLLYIFIYFLRRWHVLKPKPKSVLLDKNTGLPIPFAIIRVFSVAAKTQILQKVTDKIGKYFIIVPNGNYYIQIDRKNEDATYTTLLKTEPFEVKNGVIDREFRI